MGRGPTHRFVCVRVCPWCTVYSQLSLGPYLPPTPRDIGDGLNFGFIPSALGSRMEKGPQSLGLVLAASPPTHHKEHFGQGDPGRGKPRQGCSCQQAITCDSMSPSAFFHVRLPAERPEVRIWSGKHMNVMFAVKALALESKLRHTRGKLWLCGVLVLFAPWEMPVLKCLVLAFRWQKLSGMGFPGGTTTSFEF